MVNLSRDWPGKRGPRLYWGDDRLPLERLHRAPLSDYGSHSGYYAEKGRYTFMLRFERLKEFGLEKEKVYLAGSFNGWAAAIGDDRWRLRLTHFKGESYHALKVDAAVFEGEGPHLFKFVTAQGHWLEAASDAPNVFIDEEGNRNYRLNAERTGRHRFFFRTPLPLSRSPVARLVYQEGDYTESVPMLPGVFLKQLSSHLPLGARVEGGQTVFRLFAPRASRVMVHLYDDLEETSPRGLPMRLADGKVWEVAVPGNRDGWYYYFSVAGAERDGFSHFDGRFRILDPYAKACVGPLGPGIVLAPERFPAVKRPFTPPAWHDMVVVEVHLRDLLARAPIDLEEDARGGYRGLTAWLKEESCYLRELGVNTVELQPVHEFDTVDPKEYGWGYMPVNYFSPASHYAKDPTRATQVAEFRALVDAFHEAGLAVVLDVVYNHVGNPNYLQYIDKDYYFLLSEDGEYMNYSGCGNTMDPDTPMSRRLMADSLLHFLEVYDVDGFRFDLGELLGIECLKALEEAVKSVKPGAFLTAEPWSFRSHLGASIMETGVSAWNDGFREFVRGYVRGEGNAEGLKYFMQGSRGNLAAFPAQTVNYLCSHDDRVWIDKVTENPHHDGTNPTPNDRRRSHLAFAILLCSVGVPMLHGGLDFLYSKGGLNNTYINAEANILPYRRMRYFSGTHAYCRDWIRFRLSPIGRLLRLDGHPEKGYFRTWNNGHTFAILFNAQRGQALEQILFAVNPTFESVTLELSGCELREFTQWADHERLIEGGLPSARFPVEGHTVELTGLSCGLWVRS
ncbi:MAG: alpha-amylase family glycosyl hydrolase [Opitutales bacterium]